MYARGETERILKRVQNALGDMGSVRVMSKRFENDDEFVATEPYNAVVRSDCILDASGGATQYIISCGMAHPVVDSLKSVQVDKQNR